MSSRAPLLRRWPGIQFLMRRILALSVLAAWLPAAASMEAVDAEVAAHPGQSGVYVLETGTEALIARAWLVDNARSSIEAQYFIWSTDNIGILAGNSYQEVAAGIQADIASTIVPPAYLRCIRT